MNIDCKQFSEKYAALQKQAAEFALTVEAIKNGKGDLKAAKLEKKKLLRQRGELQEFFDYAFEKWVVKKLERLLTGPNVLSLVLAGMTCPQAEALRGRGGEVAKSYAGVDSPAAWKMREIFWKLIKWREEILRTLAGLDCENAWVYREQGLQSGQPEQIDAVIEGLLGCDSDRAFALREKMFDRVSHRLIAESLKGLDSPRAWRLRERLEPELRLVSIAGLNSERAWRIRMEHLTNAEKEANDKKAVDALQEICNGLVGLGSSRAFGLRKRIAEDVHKRPHNGMAALVLFPSLAGVRSKDADYWRESPFSQTVSVRLRAESYNGNYTSAIVWRTARKQAALKF